MWRGHVPAAVAVVCAIAGLGPVDSAPRAAAGAGAMLLRIDAESGGVRTVVRLPAPARDVFTSGGQVWTNAAGRLLRVDPRTNRVHLVAREVAGLAVAQNEVWAALGGSRLVQFDGRTGARRRSLRLASRPLFAVGDAGFPAVANDALWVTIPTLGDPREPHTLWRLDRRTGKVRARLAIGINPTPPFAAFGSLFIVNAPRIGRNALLRVRASRTQVVEVATPGSPWGIAAGAGALWVGGRIDRVVWRLEPRTARRTATVRLPELPRGLAFALGSLWIATATGLLEVDPARGRVVGRTRVVEARAGGDRVLRRCPRRRPRAVRMDDRLVFREHARRGQGAATHRRAAVRPARRLG